MIRGGTSTAGTQPPATSQSWKGGAVVLRRLPIILQLRMQNFESENIGCVQFLFTWSIAFVCRM
jgi:hypothetical protein